jgi:hypothetical protein
VNRRGLWALPSAQPSSVGEDRLTPGDSCEGSQHELVIGYATAGRRYFSGLAANEFAMSQNSLSVSPVV